MAPARLHWLLWLTALLSCEQRFALKVHLSEIPPGSAQAYFVVCGLPPEWPCEQIPVRDVAEYPGRPYSIGLYLPGTLQLSVNVKICSGEEQLIGHGGVAQEVSGSTEALTVPIRHLEGPERVPCDGLWLNHATPDLLPTGSLRDVVLTGWGFAEGMTVTVGGQEAAVQVRSPNLASLSISPPRNQAGRLPVRALLSDSSRQRDDILAAYYGEIKMELAVAPLRFATAGVNAIAAVSIGGEPHLVVATGADISLFKLPLMVDSKPLASVMGPATSLVTLEGSEYFAAAVGPEIRWFRGTSLNVASKWSFGKEIRALALGERAVAKEPPLLVVQKGALGSRNLVSVIPGPLDLLQRGRTPTAEEVPGLPEDVDRAWAADLNRDGMLDYAVRADNQLWLLSSSTGSRWSPLEGTSNVVRVWAGALAQGGIPTLAIARFPGTGLRVFPDPLVSPRSIEFPGLPPAQAIAAAELDGDRRLELLIVHTEPIAVSLFHLLANSPDETLRSVGDLIKGDSTDADSLTDGIEADVNKDGKPDVLFGYTKLDPTTRAASGGVFLLLNKSE